MTVTSPRDAPWHSPLSPPCGGGATAVRLREVTMTYKGRTAPSVDRLSLEIPAGQIFGLLGPNGAGKSTAISLITGLAIPLAGAVEVFGRPPQRAKADIGVVSQDTALHQMLTVEYNLRFAARLRGYWGRECRDRVAAGLRLARLEDFAGARAGTLSGGMARRLAIACALVHDPRLIILDEPTAGVDPGERAMLWDHIQALAREGRTILLTTHLLDEAQALCAQVVILRAGRIAAGPEAPGALRRRYGATTVTIRAAASQEAIMVALAEIRAIDGVSQADAAPAAGGGYEVTVSAAAHDGIAGRVITALTASGADIADAATSDAGLDEVFLHLTGFPPGPAVTSRALRAAGAVWAIAAKDAKVALTERMSLLQALTLPLNYLIALSLFALAGGHDPVALVMDSHGSYARQLASSMASARTFSITDMTAQQAAARMRAGTLVAAVTIPPGFDRDIREHRTAVIRLVVNNLNEDLTYDAERGMRLALEQFYQAAAPDQVPVTIRFQDQYETDTGYIAYLGLSVVVISMLVAGLLAAGNASAREHEERTMRGLLLAPVRLRHILAGRILGSFLISLPSVAIVMAVVALATGSLPEYPLAAAGTALLTLAASCAAGTALGTLARDRTAVALLTRALPVPLFFLTGVFTPLSYSTPAVQWIGGLLPLHYAVTLTQWGFRGLVTGTIPLPDQAAILAAALAAFAGAGAAALHLTARTRPARRRAGSHAR